MSKVENMKREIKFRFWDKESERMIDNPYHFEIYHYSDENRTNQQEWRCYEEWRDLEDGVCRVGELMQFTELTDKKRVELYEGDVIEIWVVGTLDESPHIERLTIVFKVGTFCAENERRSISLYRICKNNPLNKFYECLKIGNIYESPELLNQ